LGPLLASGAAAAALGFHLLSLIPAQGRAYLLIPFLILFLAMTILDQEPGWNLALLMGFSFTAGLLLKWSDAAAGRWSTWLIFLGLLGAALIGAVVLGKKISKGLRFLIPLTALYMLGWVGVLIWDLPPWVQGVLILSGLILFTVIAAGALQRCITLEVQESPIPPVIELWVILFNLFWLAGLFPFGG
jgi:hypothetical protein